MEYADLTERQKKILQATIHEYVQTAEPVGSETLVQNYEFDFSPATTRNEMAELTRLGYLKKDHASAGRAPTSLGFRYYIKNLMREHDLPVVNEIAIKQRLWDQRHDLGHLLREAALALAEETQNLTLIVTDDGRIYASGAAHILRHPEFYDIDVTRTVLHLIDQYDMIQNMLSQISSDADFGILLGEEMGIPTLSECGMVISRIDLPRGQMGYITVLGPYRLNYDQVIPTVKYLQHVVNELTQNW